MKNAITLFVTLWICVSCTHTEPKQKPITNKPTLTIVQKKAVLPDLKAITNIKKRKQTFLTFLAPLVEEANHSILQQRQQIQVWKNDPKRWHHAKVIAEQYKVAFEPKKPTFWKMLLTHVDVIPADLVLAQAAIESAWGTSRFVREANNFFGVHCHSVGCGIIPAGRTEGQRFEVTRYDSPSDAITAYMKNLNRHRAYRDLRKTRADLRQNSTQLSGHALAAGLILYSERGKDYVTLIRDVIRQNKLKRFI